MGLLHVNMEGRLLRCIAVIDCPFGGAVMRTPLRGNTELPTEYSKLPLGTSGSAGIGGAHTSVSEFVKEKMKERAAMSPIEQMLYEDRLAARGGVSDDVKHLMNVDAEQWEAMTGKEREAAILPALPQIKDRIRTRLEDETTGHNVSLEFEKGTGTVEASVNDDGEEKLIIGKTFLKTAPLQDVWNAVALSYGKILYRNQKRVALNRAMKMNDIPLDNYYTVENKHAYKYMAVCESRKHPTWRHEKKAERCEQCLEEGRTENNRMMFADNKDYQGD